MAEPVGGSSAIDLLEDAVHLLRQSPPGTLLSYWLGAVPLALGALRFWNDVTNPRTPELVCLVESFAMAVLLVWMNCWRGVFAGRLRRQLTGGGDERWTAFRIHRLAALQAWLGASRLLVLPFALLIGFPLAATIAFYRDAASLSDLGLEPAEVMRRARRVAGRNQGLSWRLFALLVLLGFLVLLNVFLTLALLPQLFRMLTGYESVFSRGGQYFLTNSMFAAVVVAVTWLAFDPYAQAVFTIRGFRAESIETGEDLRAGLRRLRATAAVVLAIGIVSPHASAGVTEPQLREAARQAAAQHEYDWRLPPPAAGSAEKPWFIEFTDRVIAGVRKALDGLGDLLGRFFRWLNDRFRLNRPTVENGVPPAVGLHWTIVLLTAAAALAAAWVVWRMRRRRTASPKPAAAVLDAIQLEAEDLAADRLPEEEWLAMAERCLGEGNLRLALRALYLANLAWLGRREWIAIHPGKTNREYEVELRRRARAVPAARDLFAANVRAFERVWYGRHEATAEEFEGFRRRAAEMKALGAAA